MRLLLRTPSVAAAVLLTAAATVALIAPRHAWFAFSMPVVWATVIVLAVAGALLRAPASRVGKAVARRPRLWVAGGAAVGTVLTALHAPLASVEFGWDVRHLVMSTEAFIADEPPTSRGYYTRYPGSLPLLAYGILTARLGELFGLTPLTSLVVAQVLMVGALLWLLGNVIVRLGRPAAVLPVQAIATLLLGLNAAVSVPYSDLPAAVLVALSLWAGVRALESGRFAWWVVAVLALVPTFSFKPYTIALLAAAVPLSLMSSGARPWRRAVSGVVVGAAVVLGGASIMTPTAAVITGRDAPGSLDPEEAAYPAWRWVVLGTHDSGPVDGPREYGGLSGAPAEVMRDLDPSEWSDALREAAVRQVTSRTVSENVTFFTNKVFWTWGDGTFWAFGEGRDREQHALLDPPWDQVQAWSIGSGAPYRTWNAGVSQGAWILTLFVAALTCWRRRDHRIAVACALILVVLSGYLMIFETRPRYLIALMPVVLVLVGLGAMPQRRSDAPLAGSRPIQGRTSVHPAGTSSDALV